MLESNRISRDCRWIAPLRSRLRYGWLPSRDRQGAVLKRCTKATLLIVALAAAGAAHAADELVLDLDPAQTQVQFTLGDVLHTVHGTFQLEKGSIRFDPETGKASGEVAVAVVSGASGNGTRDHKMHKEILESQRFPEATFAPDRVEGHYAPEGTADLQIHGLMKIHGAAHEVTFATHVESKGGEVAATMRFMMPYVQWGLKNPSTFLLRVSDKVQLDIRTAGHIHPAGSSSAQASPASQS